MTVYTVNFTLGDGYFGTAPPPKRSQGLGHLEGKCWEVFSPAVYIPSVLDYVLTELVKLL